MTDWRLREPLGAISEPVPPLTVDVVAELYGHSAAGGGTPLGTYRVTVQTTPQTLAELLGDDSDILDDASEVWLDPGAEIRMSLSDDADEELGLRLHDGEIYKFGLSLVEGATFYASDVMLNIEVFGASS